MAEGSATDLQEQHAAIYSRRPLLVSLAVASVAGLELQRMGSTAELPQPSVSCALSERERHVDAAFCAAFARSVQGAVADSQALPPGALHSAAQRLWDQEISSFLNPAASDATTSMRRRAAAPSLDSVIAGGGDARLFGLLNYCLYKAVSDGVAGGAALNALARDAGARLAAEAAPDAMRLAAAAAEAGGGRASDEGLRAAVGDAVRALERCGFACGHELSWGDMPLLPAYGEIAALERAGEEAAGGDAPARDPGTPPVGDAVAVEEGSRDDDGSSGFVGGEFQLKLYRPADIIGSTALRAETEGFWGQLTSSVLLAVVQAAGRRASVDEYFLMDEWMPPPTLAGKVLLFLGDPLLSVQVPWEPTTLVQDWTLLDT